MPFLAPNALDRPTERPWIWTGREGSHINGRIPMRNAAYLFLAILAQSTVAAAKVDDTRLLCARHPECDVS